ncbi:tyrosine-type recombinase/integrase [Haladaptatus cibarius]|uniref:tyrosine-type recombinase/integrase n=1 Tax=Haladaptatus cibarius TaxID=453847 RepID=UPI000B0988B5|nr:phage integrase SAM-like domain-containing protein [Haladaptatus cibarius]
MSEIDETKSTVRNLSPVEAAERFIAARENRNSQKTVRSYRNRLNEFVAWAEENDIESMRDLDGWWLDEFERYLETTENAPTTIKGKMSALNQLLQYCASIEVVDERLPEKCEPPKLTREEETSDDLLASEDAKEYLAFYRDSTKHYGTIQHVVLELIWHIGGRISCFRALDYGDWYPDQRKLEFRHRPPTRLKKEGRHERNVLVCEPVAEALDFWRERERPEKRDDNGRRPLLTTSHGRASDSSIRCWAYQATQPCLYTGCPHNSDRESCSYTQRQHSSKCPSSRGPHAIRTGSITWQLNNGISYVKVAKRAAASPETIRRYYDKPDYDEELERRRPETENLDILTSPF